MANKRIMSRQCGVIVAIMLRNVRTRFFGNGFGFLVAIAWPLAHILILLLINATLDRVAPYGESLTVFFASGLVPFMTFSYMSRFIMISVVQNRPLLMYPEVKIMDLVLAGAFLEVISSCCMVIALLGILAIFGIDFVPHDIVKAASAFGAALLLGFGFGIVNAAIAMAIPTWVTGYTLLTVVLYLFSGIFFLPDALPERVRHYLSFNPALQTVEWMRAAYYDGYGSMLAPNYTLCFGAATLLAGLVVERVFRGKLLLTK